MCDTQCCDKLDLERCNEEPEQLLIKILKSMIVLTECNRV